MSVPELVQLGPARCHALLASVPLGRLAFVRDGRPAIRPVNFTVAGEAIWLRSGRNSWADRLDGQPVTFEADAYDPAGHTGWSVIVSGIATLTTDVETVAAQLGADLRSWAPPPRDRLLRISVDRIEGRRLALRPDADDATESAPS
ncbi:pyridoxamine 5'-phosphate oxidase family protein [Amycolatopsis sp. NPDC024027]|uniref:pyridoxamine 5'-phosphate oxidase family protein n=1 Tax=Amycolatopsis sp. NPDC024027 TaxID=3154327 RepID=UPI00340944D7